MSSVAITWFPPSWIEITALGKHISIDPAYMKTYFKNYPNRMEFSSWPDPIDGLPEEMEPADVILITHHHKDHCKRVTVNRLKRPDTLIVAPLRCTRELGEDIRKIKADETLQLGDIMIKATPAYNHAHGKSTRKQHKKGEGVGYLIQVKDRTIYHAGDTDFIPDMQKLGPVDVALLPVGGTYTMDVGEAVEAAMALKPGVVIPIHRFHADLEGMKKTLETGSDIPLLPLGVGGTYILE